MKIYCITSYVEKMVSHFFTQVNEQYIKEVDVLKCLVGRLVQRGNKIGDFMFCGTINVCKTSVFELLKENFKELKDVDLRYNKTQKEPKARNIKTFKMVAQRRDSPNCFL